MEEERKINEAIFIEKILSVKEEYKTAIHHVLNKIQGNLDKFTYNFPSSASENLIYHPVKNKNIYSGYWTGILWLAYEITGDDRYRHAAEIQLESFRMRLDESINIDNINLGNLYTLSCVAAYKVTGNIDARNDAIRAADKLLEKFHEKGQFITAFNDSSIFSQEQNEFIEIPSLMNLPILYWASAETGDKRYHEAAVSHLNQVIRHNIREDGSTYQLYFIDDTTGEPLYGKNVFGYANESCWSRGQALGIYGLVLNYIYTGDTKLLYLSKRLVNYFLSRLPEDNICYWDLFFITGNEPRDTAAAVIGACGMLELAKYLPITDKDKYIYENTALNILSELIRNYTTDKEEFSDSNGILMGGVLVNPDSYGVGECLLIGEYFYFETLMKLYQCHRLYW